jgi:hypothetical protein
MNRGFVELAAMFAHHVSDAGDDGLTLGLQEKVDFHFDALTDLVGVFQQQQRSGHAQVQDLPSAPSRFGDRAHARWPLHVMPAGAA